MEGPVIPNSLRFELETDQTDQDPVYCKATTSNEPTSGHREARLEELSQQCYAGSPRGELASNVQARALRLRWHVVTNTAREEPFDFCMKELHVLTD